MFGYYEPFPGIRHVIGLDSHEDCYGKAQTTNYLIPESRLGQCLLSILKTPTQEVSKSTPVGDNAAYRWVSSSPAPAHFV